MLRVQGNTYTATTIFSKTFPSIFCKNRYRIPCLKHHWMDAVSVDISGVAGQRVSQDKLEKSYFSKLQTV